ncbi:MAG: ABC transporter permease [Cryomorphaceae bacterium]|nr:MAG: ABC transporter permease [Cryomorphaceae bacterium]
MNLTYISLKNILSKPLSSTLSLLLLVLGVAMISFMMVVNDGLDKDFRKNIKDIDMVVGAKGSPLQLILSAVYQIDNPTGNINYLDVKKALRNPLVEKTIPLAYGDNYAGYRIVGSTEDYPAHYEMELATGALWHRPFECTIGAAAAKATDLGVGDTFFSMHGLSDDDTHVHDNIAFKIVGIFKESGTVLDRLILTSIESVWLVHDDHDHATCDDPTHDHGPIQKRDTLNNEPAYDPFAEDYQPMPVGPDREITAMLVQFKSAMGLMTLPNMINRSTNFQSALPAIEINRLFDLFGAGIAALRMIALAIIIISALSMFISLYNSLKERRYELALMRSMGASPARLFLLILIEANLLAVAGIAIGFMVSRFGLIAAQQFASSQLSGSLVRWVPLVDEYTLFVLVMVVANLAAIIPAYQSTKLIISDVLSKK